MLLGWTRLLDEWVIGLTRYNRSTAKDPVCWEERDRTSSTLADAATRVRSFAYRAADIEPTLPLDDATLRFELQGRVYRVAIEQRWPSTPDEMSASAGPWLEQAQARARDAADHDEHPVGVLFITPRLPRSLPAGERFATADSFIGASRSIRCSGCAFSFPDARELDRYRYGNDEHPGALLLVQPSIGSP
jgi:hypothetical protein